MSHSSRFLRCLLPTVMGVSLLFVWGCSTPLQVTGKYKPTDVRPGMARVCVFQTLVLPLGSYVTYDNGKPVGATNNRSHFCYHTRPGIHVFETRLVSWQRGPRIAIDLKPGMRYALWNNAPVNTINGPKNTCPVAAGETEWIALVPWLQAQPHLASLPAVRFDGFKVEKLPARDHELFTSGLDRDRHAKIFRDVRKHDLVCAEFGAAVNYDYWADWQDQSVVVVYGPARQ